MYSGQMFSTYDLLTTAVVAIELILVITAVWFWFKSEDDSLKSVLWLLIIFFVPVFGPAVFLAVHSSRRSNSQGSN